MTSIYFIRHAQPIYSWEDDRTRPLTDEGMADSQKVTDCLKDMSVDLYISSPYKRSVDTIKGSAKNHNMIIHTDERFRERKKGPDGNVLGMFQKRWTDLDYCEDEGESIHMVQKRNIEALLEVLSEHKDKNIVIGTHGTALSSILNYFNPDYGCNDFLRIIDYTPYIVRLDFEGIELVEKEELLIVEKEYKFLLRADKKD